MGDVDLVSGFRLVHLAFTGIEAGNGSYSMHSGLLALAPPLPRLYLCMYECVLYIYIHSPRTERLQLNQITVVFLALADSI